MNLQDLKSKLKKIIAEEGIAPCIKALRDLIPENKDRYEDVLLIESRQNETNRQRLRNLISNEDLQISYARIRQDLMNLIDALSEVDLDENAENSSAEVQPKGKKGKILHRIPDQMQIHKETKCTVRIALNEEVIIKNIDLDEEVVLKSIRVSDIMQVELLDPSNDQPFKINSISSQEQFIEENEFTEWIFYVTPQKKGTYSLILKVAVIELILNKERKREIVLEESIQIITEPSPKTNPNFKTSSLQLSFGGQVSDSQNFELEGKTSSIGRSEGKKMNPSFEDISKGDLQQERSGQEGLPEIVDNRSESSSRFSVLKRMSMALLALLIFTGASYAFVPSEVDWIRVKYLADNKNAYQSYIQRYESSRHLEEAYYRKAIVNSDLLELREYTQKYPEGRYLGTINAEIREVETEQFELLQLNPSRKAMENYLQNFPDGRYSNEVDQRIKEIDTSSRGNGIEEGTENKLWQKVLKDNSQEDLNLYLRQYPNGKHAAEAKKRLANLSVSSELNQLRNAKVKDLENVLQRHPDSDAKKLIDAKIQRLNKRKRNN